MFPLHPLITNNQKRAMNKLSLMTIFITHLLILSGCVKEKVINETDKQKINFSAEETSSRAVIGNEGFPVGSVFSVFGYMTKETQTASVFEDKVDVTLGSDGKWTYDGVRYWIPGWTYDFYAVHPVFPAGGPVASVASDGTISVTNFDCSKTGAEAKDLMTAQKTGITYTGDTPPSPVDLKFSHELAKVNFVVKSEGSDVVITNISLIDAGYNGELNNGLWTITSKSMQGKPETFTNLDITLSPDGTILEVFGGDMLLIPLNETDFKCKIELEYKYLYNGIYYESGLKEISLNAGTVKSWDKGGNYKYTITIPKFTEELQLQVEVLPWDKEENASVEW